MNAFLKKRFVVWLTLAALLHAAASPLFAALRVDGLSAAFSQICTVGGLKAQSDQPAAPAQGDHGRIVHCVFCLGGAWQPPVHAPISGCVPLLTAQAALPPAPAAPLLERFVLQPVSPRAP